MIAETLRSILLDIRDEHGTLTAEIVRDVARDRKHPLHTRVFDRPIKDAAEGYYLDRARHLIRSVKIVYREADESEDGRRVRAFQPVTSDSGPASFVPVEEVAADPAMTKLVLDEMRREWMALHRRYQHMAEFVDLVKETLAA